MKSSIDQAEHQDSLFSMDTLLLLLAVVLANTHLIAGNLSAKLVFLPDAFLAGELWRVFTFPFVHAGWYHLFLDAGAFFFLYTGLSEKRWTRRLSQMGICGSVSLAAVWLTSPDVYALGLNGLSGIGHGLMAISTLEMTRYPEDRWIGVAGFLILISKCLFEVLTGNVLFHFGLCGTPLAVSHAGGVLGGVFVFCVKAKTSTILANRC